MVNELNVYETTQQVKISPMLKVDRAYEELKRLIITLQLEPGAHVDEREIMEQFDIGRTPLREAILRLVHERLIVHTPRRGVWVSPLSLTELRQMLESRATLESAVARLAAERMSEDHVATLWGMLDTAHTVLGDGDSEQLVNLDFRLHCFIAECSGNDYLASFAQQINSSMIRYWHLSSRNSVTLPTWDANHEELVRAISSGDPNLAEAQARRHVDGLRELLRDVLI